MTDLQTSIMELGKGLDLTSSKLSAAVGSLLSCLNYEITDTKGLSRIDGYEAYDGRDSPNLTSWYVLTFASAHGLAFDSILTAKQAIIGTTTLTETLLIDAALDVIVDGSYSIAAEPDSYTTASTAIPGITRDIVVGRVVKYINATTVILKVSNLDMLGLASTLYKVNTTTGASAVLPALSDMVELAEYYTDVDDMYDTIVDFQSAQGQVEDLGYPASGLHHFVDTSYAVAPVQRYTLTPVTAAGNPVAGTYTHSIAAGTWLGNDYNSAIAFVIAVTEDTSGDYDQLLVDMIPSDTLAWNDAVSQIFPNPTTTITNTGFVAGTAATATTMSTTALTSISPACLVGTLYRSYSEQQLVDDAVEFVEGWRPLNIGYLVDFENGDAVSGSLTKLERSFLTVPTAATYYLSNGSTVYSCELVSYYTADGDFTLGTAEGVLQLRNIELDSGSLDTIDSTYSLYSALPAAPGTLVADLASDLEYNSLIVNPILVQDNTRYEFVNANFYADADWDAFYGVNGSGRAFYYTHDGLFAKIFTQADDTKDKPRHITNHLNHLALGFREGSVQISVVGEPWNFSGADGASDHGIGDKVTGLMTMNGDTLAVFAEQSIWAIAGSTVDNFTSQVLAPHTGCIEYTLVNIGVPVYCNQSGIVTLEQSEKYGNFVGRPLSYKVNTWLRPRLNRISGKTRPQFSVIAALPVRAKNQYRLYFKDGEVLTMTLMSDAGEPEFTMQRYYYDDGSDSIVVASSESTGSSAAEVSGVFPTLTVWALCSQVDSNGEERLFFSHYNPRTGSNSQFVYAMDKGWAFGYQPIPHYFETNWFGGEVPNQYFGLSKVRVHGLTKGKANLKIQASGTQPDYESEYNDTVESFSLPKADAHFDDDYWPCSSSTNLSNRGMSIQIKISDEGVTDPEPSHVIQVLVLQTKPGGKVDG